MELIKLIKFTKKITTCLMQLQTHITPFSLPTGVEPV